jgi:ferredoxin-nitrate reductase
VAPGGDIPLMNAVARLLIEQGADDGAFIEAHTEGFAASARPSSNPTGPAWSRPRASRRRRSAPWPTGSRARAFLTFLLPGAEPEHRRHVEEHSIINLHLLTGQVGKPGAGPSA